MQNIEFSNKNRYFWTEISIWKTKITDIQIILESFPPKMSILKSKLGLNPILR